MSKSSVNTKERYLRRVRAEYRRAASIAFKLRRVLVANLCPVPQLRIKEANDMIGNFIREYADSGKW